MNKTTFVKLAVGSDPKERKAIDCFISIIVSKAKVDPPFPSPIKTKGKGNERRKISKYMIVLKKEISPYFTDMLT